MTLQDIALAGLEKISEYHDVPSMGYTPDNQGEWDQVWEDQMWDELLVGTTYTREELDQVVLDILYQDYCESRADDGPYGQIL